MADSGFFRKDIFISYAVKNEKKKQSFRIPNAVIKGFLHTLVDASLGVALEFSLV